MTAATATRPGTAASTKRWRTVLVWLHVLTSFVWMSQALALSTVVGAAVVTADADFRVAAMDVAVLLDNHLLAPFGNASAFTGFVLAAATPWGFFRHRWVLTKFVITVVQLNVGIFVLSSGLHRAQQVAAAGQPIGWWPSVAGGALMASAIAFQGWLSLAKPWGKTQWAATRGPKKLPTATTVVFVSSVAAVAVDLVLSQLAGFPFPLVELVVLIWVLTRRALTLRRATSGRSRELAAPTAMS
ncbi:MAG: hypothetical protein GEV09_04185 [Pseudonocardiaceae bacterium]|nr:hypothetical protein [Pseudonocardiaceae bacterium]